ncbi:hypothetical protein BUE80_DR012122 [Diplocarpon rosae]|nr:hypothetical protein BUE80_DR012122 [Diplocarpon rosae]
MAQKAKKDRAKANTTSLNQLHIGTATLNGLFIIFNLVIKRRSLLAWVIISIPCFIAECILETSGRPKYDATTKALKSAGEDLAASGLTEYMFDIVWVTWLSLILVMFLGNWGWIVWSAVPAYGLYKGYGFLGMAKGMMSGAQQGNLPGKEQVSVGGNRKQRRAA